MLAQAEKALHLSVNLTTQLLTFSKGGKPVKKLIELAAGHRERGEVRPERFARRATGSTSPTTCWPVGGRRGADRPR